MGMPKISFSKNNSRILLALIIFLVALFLRLSYQSAAIVHNPIQADAKEYFLTSYNLYKYGVYSIEEINKNVDKPRPIWRRLPGYPFFLYPFFYFSDTTGEFIVNVSLAQALLSSITCVLTYLIGLIIFSLPWAFLAGIMTALSPHLIALDDFMLSESLFIFTIVAATLTLLLSLLKRNYVLTITSGSLFCFSCLIRAISGFLGPFMVMSFIVLKPYWVQGKKLRILLPILSFMIGFGLLYFPYAQFRNIIIANSVWVTNESAWRHFVIGADINLENFIRNKTIPESIKETEKMISDRAYGLSVLSNRFRNDPTAFLKWYFVGKFLYMWKWDNVYVGDVYQYPMIARGFHQGNWLSMLHRLMHCLHWPTLCLSILGTVLFLITKQRDRLQASENLLFAPILIFVYFSLVLTVLIPLPRYAIPLRPFVYLIGCYPLMLSSRKLHQFMLRSGFKASNRGDGKASGG